MMSVIEVSAKVRDEKLKTRLQVGASQAQEPTRATGKFNLAKALSLASQKSGRSVFELSREFFRLSRGRGRLSFQEYLQYGVYDLSRHDRPAQERFITDRLHWPITRTCCDMSWQATTEDKWLSALILAESGIAMPQTLAVIDRSHRHYPNTRIIKTAEQFREFVLSAGILPIFAKETQGMGSLGAFLITEADRDRVHLHGEGWFDYATLMDKFVGDTSYLLQPVETNHEALARHTSHLATIRLCILMEKDGVNIPFAVLKLPAGDNITDNFWRSGNLACGLDPATGTIQTIREKGAYGTREFDAHPQTGEALIGVTLPMWDRVIELAETCAPIFQPIRYQSMDVAITPSGPKLIEINTGGGFDLPQLATGQGFLSDAVIEHFRHCGFKGV